MPQIVLNSDEDGIDALAIDFRGDWVLANEQDSDFWRCIPQDRVKEIYATDDEKNHFTFDN